MKKRIRIKKNTIFLDKIVVKYGPEETARMLGVTSTAIKTYLRDGQCPQTAEMAAELLYERSAMPDVNKTALITGGVDFIEAVHKMADLSKVEFKVIN